MLLSLSDLVRQHRMKVTGVIHCGAHLAEEAPEYNRLFPKAPVWWIEANTDVTTKIQSVLARYPNQQLIVACLWSAQGVTKTLNVTNYDGMSSSLLEFGTHPTFSPDTVFVDHRQVITDTLDHMWDCFGGFPECNLINMDLQGVELDVLRGATRLLPQIDYAYCEINTDEVYKGCSKLPDMDTYLGGHGFRRVAQSIVPGQGWGDALWVRR